MNNATNTNNGMVDFVLKAVERGILNINTSNMATVTAISDDKTKLDITIDSSKEELPDVPFITLQGGSHFLQFPIAIGDKCIAIFSKDTVEDWLSGNDEFIYNSNFDINNGFALVGINTDTNAIPIQAYTDFKVDKIKIRNSGEELVTLLSDTTQALSDTNDVLSNTQVIVTAGSSAGTYDLTTKADFISLKATIDDLKTRLDTFKV